MSHFTTFYNLAQMSVTSSGSGNVTLDAATAGQVSFDVAGCSTAGQEVTYAISNSSQSEVNRGTYYSSSLLLTRTSTTHIKSTNSDSPIVMTSEAVVAITAQTWDLKIAPTITTITAAGSGTYTPPLACAFFEIIGIGGGQGGQGAGGGTAPSAGGATTFNLGSSTLTANGGSSYYGGSASGGSIGNFSGGDGGNYLPMTGGNGGDAFFGGGGSQYSSGINGGGGGGGTAGLMSGTFNGGCGGGSGGMFWHIEAISSISSALSYSYSVGTGSLGTAPGGNISSATGYGGDGANGMILIKEYYIG